MIQDKKVVFVTGGSRGIGKSISNLLLESGYCVAVGYYNNKDMTQDVVGNNPNGIPVRVDINDRQSIKSAVVYVNEYFGNDIDILINNAAIAQEKPFSTITDDDWDNMFKTNLRGPFTFSQEVLSGMIKKGWGRIINITSIGGQWGGFNQVHYAAAKAGLINLTRSLAKIYSVQGINTNAVAIGLVSTDMTRAELNSDAGREKVKNIPMGRIAEADEVAQVVKFLCSDDASYITGQTLNVNGGMYFG